MKYSILIPAYNSEKTIYKTIKSALDQRFDGDYEILVADNASTDGTSQIIKSFDSRRIRIITNPKTVSMYANHNICCKEAQGDYVIFIHSDDCLRSDALAIVDRELSALCYPQKIMLWGNTLTESFYDKLRAGGMNLNCCFCGEQALKVFSKGGLTVSGTCISRKSLLEINIFPDSPCLALDWYLNMYAALNGFEFEMIDRVLYDRNFATCSNGWGVNEWSKERALAVGHIFKNINGCQSDYFKWIMIYNAPLEHYAYLKNYMPGFGTKLRFLIKRFLQYPRLSTINKIGQLIRYKC